jgi:hypothetical protein
MEAKHSLALQSQSLQVRLRLAGCVIPSTENANARSHQRGTDSEHRYIYLMFLLHRDQKISYIHTSGHILRPHTLGSSETLYLTTLTR